MTHSYVQQAHVPLELFVEGDFVQEDVGIAELSVEAVLDVLQGFYDILEIVVSSKHYYRSAGFAVRLGLVEVCTRRHVIVLGPYP